MEDTRGGGEDRSEALQGQVVEERYATIGGVIGSAGTGSSAKPRL
ncbi:MAG TPA: hypothetical protein VGP89_05420 [Candidatus Angelobacter sp.]|nr:hypothetical protein [Candidatus Angelobacter sp.]